jgi:hypothetical protein
VFLRFGDDMEDRNKWAANDPSLVSPLTLIRAIQGPVTRDRSVSRRHQQARAEWRGSSLWRCDHGDSGKRDTHRTRCGAVPVGRGTQRRRRTGHTRKLAPRSGDGREPLQAGSRFPAPRWPPGGLMSFPALDPPRVGTSARSRARWAVSRARRSQCRHRNRRPAAFVRHMAPHRTQYRHRGTATLTGSPVDVPSALFVVSLNAGSTLRSQQANEEGH